MTAVKAVFAALANFLGKVIAVAGNKMREANAKSQAEFKRTFLLNFYQQHYNSWSFLLYQAICAVNGISGLHKPRTQRDLQIYDPGGKLPVLFISDRPCLIFRAWKNTAFKPSDVKRLEYFLRVELDNICGSHSLVPFSVKVMLDPVHNTMVRIFLALRYKAAN